VQHNNKEYIHHFNKLCSDYNMNALDVYNVLLSKNDDLFPLSFETIKYKVLKDVEIDVLKNIFTLEELKSIFSNTNVKKIKNLQTRKFIQAFN